MEAAKFVECDEGTQLKRRRSAHKMLEKSRRADMKNLFDTLKGNVPKIKDWVKCSNLAILTGAKKHIMELTELDVKYQQEKEELCRSQVELKEHIRMLLRDERLSIVCF